MTTDDALALVEAAGYRGATADAALVRQFDTEVTSLTAFHDRAQAYSAESRRVMDNVKAAASKVLSRKLQTLLAEEPVESLAEYPLSVPASSVRLLKNAGLNNLRDLSRFKGRWGYTEIRGIGEVKSQEIHEAYLRVRNELKTKIRVTFAKPLPHDEIELLDALQQMQILLVSERSLRKHTAEREAVEELLPRTAALAEPIRNKLTWWFPNSAKKVQARRDIVATVRESQRIPRELTTHLYEDYFTRIQDQLHEPTAKTIADFEAEPSAFFSLLARLLGQEEGSMVAPAATATGEEDKGLTAELWQSILATELDLDGLTAILRPYQEFGVKFLVHQRRTLLGDDPGTGKTLQSLAYMIHTTNRVEQETGVRPVHLVVAPLSVQANWVNEIRKHSTMHPHRLLSRTDRIPQGVDIIVGTYERVSDALSEQVNGVVVVDEAHFIKNAETGRTQRVRALIEDKDDVTFMSGTALENRLGELSQLASFVNPPIGQRLEMLGEHAVADQYRQILAEVYIRRNKEDVISELPELIQKEETVEMGDAERARYVETLGEPYPWHALRKLGYENPDFALPRRVAELIADAQSKGEKVLLFSFYLDPLTQLREYFSHLPSVRVDGDVPADERQKLVDEFNSHQGTMLYFSQINTGGIGLNLQAANRVIILEPQVKPSLVVQALSRSHRMGQRNTVLMHMMVRDDTLDPRILGNQQAKQELFDVYAKDSDIGERSAQLSKKEEPEISAKEQKQMLADERARYGVAAAEPAKSFPRA